MEFAFEMPSENVRAALLFAAKNDVRYYLNGCLFERFGKGVAIVATDGHRLTAMYHAQETMPAELAVIVERETLERAIKAHGKSHLSMVFQVFALEDVNEGRRVRILCDGGSSIVEGQEILGRFPDWRSVVPKADREMVKPKREDPVYGLNAEYLADYAKVARIFGSKTPCISIHQNVLGYSNLITMACAPHFLSVLMPATADAPTLPEWFTSEAPEDLKIAA